MTTLRRTLHLLLCIQLLLLASGAFMDFRKRKDGDSHVSEDRSRGPEVAPETWNKNDGWKTRGYTGTNTQFNSYGYQAQTVTRQKQRGKSDSSNSMKANRNSNTYAARPGVLSTEDSREDKRGQAKANEGGPDGKSSKSASSESDSESRSGKKTSKKSGGRSGKKNGNGGKGKGGKGKGGGKKGGSKYSAPTPAPNPTTRTFTDLSLTLGGLQPMLSPATITTWQTETAKHFAAFYNNNPSLGIRNVTTTVTFVGQIPTGQRRDRRFLATGLTVTYNQVASFLDYGSVLTQEGLAESPFVDGGNEYVTALKNTGDPSLGNVESVSSTPGPPTPTVSPTTVPTRAPPVENRLTPPTAPPSTPSPTKTPTRQPTSSPTRQPTSSPTRQPTSSPTLQPTSSPTRQPTSSPTRPATPPPTTAQTSSPTKATTLGPTQPPPTPAPTAVNAPPSTGGTPAPTPMLLPVDTPAPTSVSTNSSPTAKVRNIIETFALKGGDEFEDASSSQSRALSWAESNLNIENYTAVAIREYYSLVTFFYSTFLVDNFWTQGRPSAWIDTTNWLNAKADKCNWYGVVCDDADRVVQLQLGSNNLTGYIPSEITLLNETLVELWLNNSSFDAYQDEGTAWIGNLGNLKVLDLESCFVEYPGIPTSIAKLTNLQYLSLHFNAISGVLDGSIFADMDGLEYLDLSFNTFSNLVDADPTFTSTIPSEFAQLVNLKVLSLYDSFLYGDLDFLKTLVNLNTFEVYDNLNVTGTIPTEIGLMSDLAIFDSAGCRLSGPIPSEVGNLANLEGFLVYDNDLTGEIPTEFGDLVVLQLLSMELNEGLTGSIADGVCTNTAFLSSEGFEVFVSADCEITCNCCDCCGSGC